MVHNIYRDALLPLLDRATGRRSEDHRWLERKEGAETLARLAATVPATPALYKGCGAR
jgi:hypothetical protein